jgi:hypothetical protein
MRFTDSLIRIAMIVAVWAVMIAALVIYFEAWKWHVAPFECGARLLRFTWSACLPGELS